MKFNLKRLREICESEQAGACVYDALDGFEKELRETLEWTQKKWHPRTAYNRGMKAECIHRLMEILGDEK
jgi:hypothetical protein